MLSRLSRLEIRIHKGEIDTEEEDGRQQEERKQQDQHRQSRRRNHFFNNKKYNPNNSNQVTKYKKGDKVIVNNHYRDKLGITFGEKGVVDYQRKTWVHLTTARRTAKRKFTSLILEKDTI